MSDPLSSRYFSPPTLLGSPTLHRLYALLMRDKTGKRLPALSFNPLAPNQAVLFTGRQARGLSWLVQDFRRLQLEKGSTVLSFGAWYAGSDWFERDVETAGQQSRLAIVEPTLYPSKYQDTLERALESRSCLHWKMPDGGQRHKQVFDALEKALRTQLATRPSPQNRLLIILDDICAYDDCEQASRIIRLAKRTGGSIWVSTRTLEWLFRDAETVSSLFDSAFLFAQVEESGQRISEALCALQASTGTTTTHPDLEPNSFLRMREGRFVWRTASQVEFGMMYPPPWRKPAPVSVAELEQ
jgi:hypothetical protein